MATLPQYADNSTKNFASILLSKLIDLKTVDKQIELNSQDDYIQKNAKSSFDLTCKKEFEHLEEFKLIKQESEKAKAEYTKQIQKAINLKDLF